MGRPRIASLASFSRFCRIAPASIFVLVIAVIMAGGTVVAEVGPAAFAAGSGRPRRRRLVPVR